MKKLACLIIIVIVMLICAFNTSAADLSGIEDEFSDKLFSSISGDVSSALEDFGIDSLDFDSIYNISFDSVVSYFKEIFQDKLSGKLKSFARLFAVVIIMGISATILTDDGSKQILLFICTCVLVLMIVDDVNYCLSSTVSMLKAGNSFMVAFVPIYAVIVAIGGSPATALTYTSVVLFLGEIISAIINYGLVDILGLFFCLGISFSVNENIDISRLISATNKIVTFVLSFTATLFASVLSIKGIMSFSSDSVVTRGARFLLGSLIPVIGSSISEAYSSLLGSINIIKSSVAVVGILVILIINIPIMADNLLFYLSMNVLSFISELIGYRRLSEIFKVFACGVRILLLLIIFEMFVLIISTGIMLSFKGG